MKRENVEMKGRNKGGDRGKIGQFTLGKGNPSKRENVRKLFSLLSFIQKMNNTRRRIRWLFDKNMRI